MLKLRTGCLSYHIARSFRNSVVFTDRVTPRKKNTIFSMGGQNGDFIKYRLIAEAELFIIIDENCCQRATVGETHPAYDTNEATRAATSLQSAKSTKI